MRTASHCAGEGQCAVRHLQNNARPKVGKQAARLRRRRLGESSKVNTKFAITALEYDFHTTTHPYDGVRLNRRPHPTLNISFDLKRLLLFFCVRVGIRPSTHLSSISLAAFAYGPAPTGGKTTFEHDHCAQKCIRCSARKAPISSGRCESNESSTK